MESFKIAIERVEDFDLETVCTSGQTFRWKKEEDGFVGIVGNIQVLARQEGRTVTLEFAQEQKEDFWKAYFDLETDYGRIKRTLCDGGKMDEAITYAPGMRILKQPPAETVYCFIISANNNIKRIKQIIERLARKYGEECCGVCGTYYAFPKDAVLARASVEELKQCGLGYRAEYIKKTAQILSDGFDLKGIGGMEYTKGKKELMKLPGVGPKVAECILLYGYHKTDAFPIDVWIERTMKEWYLGEGATRREIECFAEKKFGKYGGMAQQYMFFYARAKKDE